MQIPVIDTARLRLRGHYPSDLGPYLVMWQQPAFYQHLTGKPMPEEEVWTKLLRHLGVWYLCGYGFWAIEEKATGDFIGAVGFGEWQRNLTPSIKGFPEVGWVLAPHAHGQGYALEAAQAALAWGDTYLPVARTVCLVDIGNLASLRLAAKVGYQEIERVLYKDIPVVLLERFAPAQLN